jgi:hypothetical protein
VQGVSTRQPGEAASSVKFFPETRVDAGFSGAVAGTSFEGGGDGGAVAVLGFAEADAAGLEAGAAALADADAEGATATDADGAGGGVAVIAIVGASLGTAIALAAGAPLAPPSLLLHASRANAATTPDTCTIHIFIGSSSDRGP